MAAAGRAGEFMCVLVLIAAIRSTQNVARAPRNGLIWLCLVLICPSIAFMQHVQGAGRRVRDGIFDDRGEYGGPERVRGRAQRERTRSELAGRRAIDLVYAFCMIKKEGPTFFVYIGGAVTGHGMREVGPNIA